MVIPPQIDTDSERLLGVPEVGALSPVHLLALTVLVAPQQLCVLVAYALRYARTPVAIVAYCTDVGGVTCRAAVPVGPLSPAVASLV